MSINTEPYRLSKALLFWLYEQGYTLGNPVNCDEKDMSFRIPYANKMALVSDELYEVNLHHNSDKSSVSSRNVICL